MKERVDFFPKTKPVHSHSNNKNRVQVMQIQVKACQDIPSDKGCLVPRKNHYNIQHMSETGIARGDQDMSKRKRRKWQRAIAQVRPAGCRHNKGQNATSCKMQLRIGGRERGERREGDGRYPGPGLWHHCCDFSYQNRGPIGAREPHNIAWLSRRPAPPKGCCAPTSVVQHV